MSDARSNAEQGGVWPAGKSMASEQFQGPEAYPDGPDPHISPPPGVANDAGSRDTVVPMTGPDAAHQAVANAMGRREETATDTIGAGSTIGDLMETPPPATAGSKHTGPPGPDAVN